MKNRPFALVALLFVAALGGCKKDADIPTGVGTVSFEVENVAGSKAVALDGTAYATSGGETFTLTTLKYYLSNVRLTKNDGTTYAAPNVYHLVDAAKPSTLAFTVSDVPAGDYTGLSFVVGVDSTTTKGNPLGLTGDLNPANSMYWVWDTGHIFMKLEGTVTSVSPSKTLTCHVGGYRAPYNAIVTAAPSLNGNTLLVRTDQAPKIHLAANVLKLFDGVSHLQLSTFPGTMMPSTSSVQVARNYAAGMFTVAHVYAN